MNERDDTHDDSESPPNPHPGAPCRALGKEHTDHPYKNEYDPDDAENAAVDGHREIVASPKETVALHRLTFLRRESV